MQRLIVVMVPTGLINGKKGFASFMTFLEAQNNVHANWNLGKLRLKVKLSVRLIWLLSGPFSLGLGPRPILAS